MGAVLRLPQGLPKKIALIALAPAFVAAGGNHFVNPDFYVQMMPAYLPAHLELVYVSGVLEILGGLGVLFERTRRAAGWGLILLLVAIFPANLNMAMNPELFPSINPVALHLRLPFQALFIAWVYWATRRDAPTTA